MYEDDDHNSWIVLPFYAEREYVRTMLSHCHYLTFDEVVWDQLLYQVGTYNLHGLSYLFDTYNEYVQEYGMEGEEDMDLLLEATEYLWTQFSVKVQRLFGVGFLGHWQGYEIESTGRDIRVTFRLTEDATRGLGGFRNLAGTARARVDARRVMRPRTPRPTRTFCDAGLTGDLHRSRPVRNYVRRPRTR